MNNPKRQVETPIRVYDYSQGPMFFLSQQAKKRMEQAGYPTRIYYHYRSAELQEELFQRGRTTKGPDVTKSRPLGRKVTNAGPYHSAHQFFLASDLVHEDLFWKAPPDYWDTLKMVWRTIEEEFNVPIKHGSDWGDYAHFELKEWRDWREKWNWQTPTEFQRSECFQQILPRPWHQFAKSKRAQTYIPSISQAR